MFGPISIRSLRFRFNTNTAFLLSGVEPVQRRFATMNRSYALDGPHRLLGKLLKIYSKTSLCHVSVNEFWRA